MRDAGRAVELGLHVARDAAAVVFVAPRDELVSRCPHDERIAASILAQRKQHASTASRANTIPPRESRPRQHASIVLTAKVAHRGLLWHRPVCKARVATPRPTRLAARWVVIRGPMDPPPAPRAPTCTPHPQTLTRRRCSRASPVPIDCGAPTVAAARRVQREMLHYCLESQS